LFSWLNEAAVYGDRRERKERKGSTSTDSPHGSPGQSERGRGVEVEKFVRGVWVSGDEEMEISITHRALT
jgi:hypothetical protein